MEEHGTGALLHEGVILLGFALACVMLFRKLGLGATLGYLVAGALVGPFVLGLIGGAEDMLGIAELGIVMLLFIVGLELNPGRLWRMRKLIFGLGLVQVAACGLAVFATVLALVGYPWQAALAIGLPLGLSSTAQVLPMLQSGKQLHTPFGERAFGILLFQDLSIIPLVTIVAVLGERGAESGDAMPGWQLALLTLAAVIGLVAAGRFLIRPLFRLIGRLREREMFVVAGLFTVMASAAVMELLGLSTALGAFIAGVMLADTPYRHELEADIEPFRSILLGMFFLAIGMMLDLGVIAERPGFVVGMAVALMVLKTTIITGLGMLAKMSWRSALALGLLLSQGGEFAFVLFTQARSSGLIDAETSSLFGAVVTLSMATTPFLMKLSKPIRNAGAAKDETRSRPNNEQAGALVVGYGRFGQTVAQTLMSGGVSVTLIDNKVEQIDIAEEYGFKVYFGDGTRLDLLRQAGAGNVRLIMFCIDKDQVEAEFLDSVEEAFPDAEVFVRVFDRRSLLRLRGSPMARAVREIFESAILMARLGLEAINRDEHEIEQAIRQYRDIDSDRLDRQHEAGDLKAGKDDMLREPSGQDGKAGL